MQPRLRLLVATLWLLAGSARAQAPNEASSDAPPSDAIVVFTEDPTHAGCPTAEASEAAIAEALGRPLRASPSAVTARITVLSGAAIDARIELLGADGVVLGTRTIDTGDPTCATLEEGLPLVVAMLVDLHREDAVLHLRPDIDPTADGSTPDHGAPLELALDAGVAMDLGLLPEPAWMPFVELMLGEEPLLRAWVRASFLAPQRSTRALAMLSPGADVWGVTGTLGACVLPRIGPVDLGGCAGLEGGWLQISGVGLSSPRTNDSAHLAVDLLARGVAHLGPVMLGVEAGLSVGLIRQLLVYTDGMDQRFFESSPVSFRAGLFLGIRSGS